MCPANSADWRLFALSAIGKIYFSNSLFLEITSRFDWRVIQNAYFLSQILAALRDCLFEHIRNPACSTVYFMDAIEIIAKFRGFL